MNIEITVPKNLLPEIPALQKVAIDAASEQVVTDVQAHFMQRNSGSKAHPGDWPAKGWWAMLTQLVAAQPADNFSSNVTITSPAFWRRYKGGGPITPKRGTYLALPAMGRAYAAGSPREGATPPLAPLYMRRDGKASAFALTDDVRTSKKGKTYGGRNGTIWYWLVKSANPAADPNAVPSRASLVTSASGAARLAVSAMLAARKAS